MKQFWLQKRQPRISRRGRIVRHATAGRIILSVSRDLPDGTTAEVELHATKGFRFRRGR